jgi:O-antigen/teichoic acid export membrane protein
MIRTLRDRFSAALPWVAKGGWTVFDQALFAGSNFALSIVLARWLTPDAFGAFTVAFTLFLLAGTLHNGLLPEPMLVFGSSRYRDRLQAYVRLLLHGQAALSLLLGLLLFTAGSVLRMLGSGELGALLQIVGVVQYFILFLWLVRQACYVHLQPRRAAAGGMLYLLLMMAGAFLLYRSGSLTPATALLLLGGSSAAAGVFILTRLRLNPLRPAAAGMAREVGRRHWNYGRWASATGVLEWVPGYLPFLLLPLAGGLEMSGVLKALLNFIMPVAHAYAAITLLLVPIFVRARDAGTFGRTFRHAALLVVAGTAAYGIFLGSFGETLLDLVYAGQYVQHAGLLWLVAAIPLMSGVASLLRTGLRALEQPNLVFWAYLGSSLVALTAGVMLILTFGLVGALTGFLVQMIVEIGVMTYFLAGRGRVVAARAFTLAQHAPLATADMT